MGDELGVSRRQIVYWKSEKKLVPVEHSRRICELVVQRHYRRLDRERSELWAIIDAVSGRDPLASSLVSAMLADGVRMRTEAIDKLARNDSSNGKEHEQPRAQ